MPYLPVDTAVVVEVGPCIDSTDFASLETAIAWNAAGMSVDLFENTGTAVTKTDITLTTGGANDWTHKGNGVYEVEITAAQNNTEGMLRVVGVCTGVLPFESPVYTVVPIPVYNSIVLGTDKLLVDAVEVSGDSTAADNLEAMFDGTGYVGGTIKLGTDVVKVSGDATAADNLELLTENALGADSKMLISTDDQDCSGQLHVDAKRLNGAVPNNLSSAQANAACDTAFTDYDPPTDTEMDAGFAALNDVSAAQVRTQVDNGLTTYDPTTHTEMVAFFAALNDPTAAAIADATMDEAIADHLGAGSVGAAINAAGGGVTAAAVADAVLDELIADHTDTGSLSATIASAASVGPGATWQTIKVIDSSGQAVADADVWLTGDEAANNVVAGTRQSDSDGVVGFYIDIGATYYIQAQKDGKVRVRSQEWIPVEE